MIRLPNEMSYTLLEDIPRAVDAASALKPWRRGHASSRLWVAFSGGVDSTVLLHTLRHLPGVCAIHIDHGLHANASHWARHCAKVAATWGVAFQSRAVKVAANDNLEAAARRARYAAWQRQLAAGDVLAVAHHADDQAETRLWQLLTGRYAGGMPAERSLGCGRLARPLLTVRRRAILAYAEHHGLRWIEDPSNADETLDRNYIRQRLMPLIEGRFPAAVTLLAAPRHGADAAVAPLPLADASTTANIEHWLLGAGLPLARRTIAEIQRQSRAAADRNPRVAVTPAVDAWRFAQAWHLVQRRQALDAERAAEPGQDLALANGTLGWRWGRPGLARDAALRIRWRRGGERIRPNGRQHTKTLKALLREARIPPWRRNRWPLLYRCQGLVAVPSLAIEARAVASEGWQPTWLPKSDTLTTFSETMPS